MTAPDLNWQNLMQTVLEVKTGPFMEQMQRRKEEFGSKSSMGQMDASLLYALVRTFKPRVAVETGANTGMASSFILRGMYDALCMGALGNLGFIIKA